MNKISLALLFAIVSQPILAHDRFYRPHNLYHHHGFQRHYYGYHENVLPALAIGGLVGYAIAQPRTVAPLVVYTPTPVTVLPPINNNPVIYSAPIGYHYDNIYNQSCNCFTTILVQD